MLVLEGYGLSESCAAATLNTPEAVRFGTVGRPLPGTEVAIAADGEILIRGPHVFSGYYNDPAATEEALTADGWLRSGDLGAIDADGFVTITGRKKDLIITSSGKNITPVNIESELREQPLHHRGGRVRRQPALPGRDADARPRREPSSWPAGSASPPTRPTIAQDPRVHAEIQKQVDAVNEQVRPDRADQALRDPRPRPHPGRAAS